MSNTISILGNLGDTIVVQYALWFKTEVIYMVSVSSYSERFFQVYHINSFNCKRSG